MMLNREFFFHLLASVIDLMRAFFVTCDATADTCSPEASMCAAVETLN